MRKFAAFCFTFLVAACGSSGSGDGDADGSAGAGGTDAGSGGQPGVPPLVEGCPGQQLREGIPEDLTAPGPWPVGAVTTMLGGITTEVWFPAIPGSDTGGNELIYDFRDALPASERGLIPDDRNPVQTCDCYRDLPLDEDAGPYPVLVFVHGTAGTRTTNLEQMTHWASRGFVVVSSDHPGIRLGDLLEGAITGNLNFQSDQTGDARRVLAALAAPTGDAAFLAGHLDLDRVGAMGHSAGGGAVSSLGDAVDVIIPYAGGSEIALARAQSTLHVYGETDSVVPAATQPYDDTTTPLRRLLYIRAGGHLVGGSLCILRDPQDPSNDILDLAVEFGIGGAFAPALPMFFGALFDGCNDLPEDPQPFLPASRGVEILNAASAGVFEETLHCSSAATAGLRAMESTFGADVARYAETLP